MNHKNLVAIAGLINSVSRMPPMHSPPVRNMYDKNERNKYTMHQLGKRSYRCRHVNTGINGKGSTEQQAYVDMCMKVKKSGKYMW